METVTEKITNNIESTLAAISLPDYDFTPGAVEQERVVTDINQRFPFIEISGPEGQVATKTTRGALHTLEYVITYVDDITDSRLSSDPLQKQTASVVGNLHKALMTDYTRGGLAQMTRLKNYGGSSYPDENECETFEVWMVVEVDALIDMFDMSKLG